VDEEPQRVDGVEGVDMFSRSFLPRGKIAKVLASTPISSTPVPERVDENVHQNSGVNFYCQYCPAKFQQLSELLEHYKNTHISDEDFNFEVEP
jgi:hypothetical protein